ncbi:unnamed protein product, partial [Effrenium voratum]
QEEDKRAAAANRERELRIKQELQEMPQADPFDSSDLELMEEVARGGLSLEGAKRRSRHPRPPAFTLPRRLPHPQRREKGKARAGAASRALLSGTPDVVPAALAVASAIEAVR